MDGVFNRLKISRILSFEFLSWAMFACVYFFLMSTFWGSAFVAAVLVATVVPSYIVISLGLRFAYSKVGLRGSLEWRSFGYISFFCCCGGVLQLLFSQFALDTLRELGVIPEGEARKIVRFCFHWLILVSWSLLYLWWILELSNRRERIRCQDALIAAERAELQMLRFQLSPHFLFNSLNNVVTEIQKRPEVAQEMTIRLAEYLRHTLDYRGEMIVPLVYEIEGSREYLEIERDRFGDRLKVNYDLADDFNDVRVPVFLLQPLVENAVKYGMAQSKPPWLIKVRISQEKEELNIKVSNPGSLTHDNEGNESSGVGLDVLRRRLALHYPERSQFILKQEGELVVAEIKLKGEPC